MRLRLRFLLRRLQLQHSIHTKHRFKFSLFHIQLRYGAGTASHCFGSSTLIKKVYSVWQSTVIPWMNESTAMTPMTALTTVRFSIRVAILCRVPLLQSLFVVHCETQNTGYFDHRFSIRVAILWWVLSLQSLFVGHCETQNTGLKGSFTTVPFHRTLWELKHRPF
jgi:hypothetical protein